MATLPDMSRAGGEGYTYDYNYMTFLKRETIEMIKRKRQDQ